MQSDEEGNPITTEQANERLRRAFATAPRTKGLKFNSDFRTNTDHMERPLAKAFLQSHIKFLRDAFERWQGLDPLANLNDARMEELYAALYTDMTVHAEIWTTFFASLKNTVWCERTVGIINSYATVIRQRIESRRDPRDPSLRTCEAILNLGAKQV